MKLLAVILIFITVSANATTYYVSNAGSNSNNGTSTGTPLQTISYAQSIGADGDKLSLNRGDTFAITTTFSVLLNRFTIDAYGTGAQPIITGFQTITGFTNVSGNIWQASTGVLHKAINTVTVNGVFAWKARYPDSGYSSYKEAFGTSLKTYLTGDTSLVGCEIVQRCTQWVTNIGKITAQHLDTITYSPATKYQIFGQWGYFVQNRIDFLNQPGEYVFDSSNGTLSVYSVGTPTVQMSALDTLVRVSHKDNVTLKNITLTGANTCTLKLDTSHLFNFKNCTIYNAGNYGIIASKCRDANIDSSSISDCYNIGVMLGDEFVGVVGIAVDTCKRPRFTNNTVARIGLKDGMPNAKIDGIGVDGESTQVGVWIGADSAYIVHNTINLIGYGAIRWTGNKDTIMDNYVSNWCMRKPDAGAIWTYLGSPLAHNRDSGSFVSNNFLEYGVGTLEGIFQNTRWPCAGLYSDNFSSGIYFKDNLIRYCATASVFSLEASNNTYDGNTAIDSIEGTPFYVYVPGTGLTFRNNIWLQLSSNGVDYHTMVIPALSGYSSDNNYFLQPSYGSRTKLSYNGSLYNLTQYQTTFGFDLHSKEAIPTGTLSTTPLVLTNPTMYDSTIYLTPSYIDARGNYYWQNKIVLKPFTHVILFKINPIWGTKTFYTIH